MKLSLVVQRAYGWICSIGEYCPSLPGRRGRATLDSSSPPRFEEGRHSRKKVTFAKPIGVKKTSFLPSDEGMAGEGRKRLAG